MRPKHEEKVESLTTATERWNMMANLIAVMRTDLSWERCISLAPACVRMTQRIINEEGPWQP
jgi:hypothetical protein